MVREIQYKVYKASLAITGGVRYTSQERIYNGLSLDSPADRQWYRKMIFFSKRSGRGGLA